MLTAADINGEMKSALTLILTGTVSPESDFCIDECSKALLKKSSTQLAHFTHHLSRTFQAILRTLEAFKSFPYPFEKALSSEDNVRRTFKRTASASGGLERSDIKNPFTSNRVISDNNFPSTHFIGFP